METLYYFKELFIAEPFGAALMALVCLAFFAGVLFVAWRLLNALETSVRRNISYLNDLDFDLDIEPGPAEGDILHSNR